MARLESMTGSRDPTTGSPAGGFYFRDPRLVRGAASLRVSAGANVKVVQRHLGHSTATQTLDRYAHLFTEDLGH